MGIKITIINIFIFYILYFMLKAVHVIIWIVITKYIIYYFSQVLQLQTTSMLSRVNTKHQ